MSDKVYVEFTANFDWPDGNGKRVITAYPAGHKGWVDHACAGAAKGCGRAKDATPPAEHTPHSDDHAGD